MYWNMENSKIMGIQRSEIKKKIIIFNTYHCIIYSKQKERILKEWKKT